MEVPSTCPPLEAGNDAGPAPCHHHEGASSAVAHNSALAEQNDLMAPTSSNITSEGLTCAICLDCIEPAHLALVPGCEHHYCATCILHWAVHKENPWCPQCRIPFSQLQTYRALDGTVRDCAALESLCLLKRSAWFEEYVQAREKGKAPVAAASDVSIPQEVMDWQDYSRFYEEYDDDEEVEAYYFSSAAGRARITLGNRPLGENGYISSGRMQARPRAPARPAKAAKPGKGAQSAGKGGATSSRTAAGSVSMPTPAPATPSAACSAERPSRQQRSGQPSSPGQASCAGPSSAGAGSGDGKGSGRRARRNAKRAALDARTACVFDAD